MKDQITKEQFYPHPISAVWNAITLADQLTAWFIKADFKAEVGYQYTFTSSGEDCTEITGEVKKATPYTLEYTWIVAETNVETIVRWTLREQGEGTELHLEHSGIAGYGGDTAVKMFESFNGGWENCVNLLLGYLKEQVHAG
ncbi:MAG: SRPBCC domain-containing protein [Bacteroidota bacterium]